jgi:hypothetical protein
MNSYYYLDQDLKKVIENASKITFTQYETFGDFIESEQLFNIVKDLIGEFEGLEEEFEDYKRFVEDNYKQMTIEEQVM